MFLIIVIFILSDEWNNFMERINCKKESEVWDSDENILQLRLWASLRGQTLCRTGTHAASQRFSRIFCSILTCLPQKKPHFAVRGMMYYRRALKLQAFLDMANEDGEITFL